MAMYPTHLGDVVVSKLSLTPFNFTAGDSEDDTEQNGSSVDRQDLLSGVAQVPVAATLAEDNTATISVKVEDSPDGSSDWQDYKSADDVTLTGGTGGSSEETLVEVDLNLKDARQYVRVSVTVNCSASSTDTVDGVAGILTLGGAVEKPV